MRLLGVRTDALVLRSEMPGSPFLPCVGERVSPTHEAGRSRAVGRVTIRTAWGPFAAGSVDAQLRAPAEVVFGHGDFRP